MGFYKNPQYEAVLKASTVEHGLRGSYDPAEAHLTPESVIFSIWRDGIAKLMAEKERRQFLALSEDEQRVYLGEESFFEYAWFRSEFLQRAVESKHFPFISFH